MQLETLQTICELEDRVNRATRQFHYSTVAATTHDPALGHAFGEVPLTVTDILLVAALSQTHALVTGPTGRGKTELIRLVCQGLFGPLGWFLLRLNPHLSEETFADIDMQKLKEKGLREAISPSPFLSLPCTVLDEVNRTPAALTNILLGFTDGSIELKCGVKYDVGYGYRTSAGADARYHLVIGSMNEGKEYDGTFALDAALSRRFTLQIPFGELRPTSHDLLSIIQDRSGHAEPIMSDNVVAQVSQCHEKIKDLTLDPLALIYMVYLANIGRCPYSATEFHPQDPAQNLCAQAECRIQKRANGFCPSTGRLSEAALVFLKRAAYGLAALRAARTYRAIENAFEQEVLQQLNHLRQFVGCDVDGDQLRDATFAKYCENVSVCVQDIQALLPFVGLGGKIWMAPEYVAKYFGGSNWLALRHYSSETYAAMETFFRQNQSSFQELSQGKGAIAKIQQRLEHTERFMDPVIRHAMQPFLDDYLPHRRRPQEIAEENQAKQQIQEAVSELVSK